MVPDGARAQDQRMRVGGWAPGKRFVEDLPLPHRQVRNPWEVRHRVPAAGPTSSKPPSGRRRALLKFTSCTHGLPTGAAHSGIRHRGPRPCGPATPGSEGRVELGGCRRAVLTPSRSLPRRERGGPADVPGSTVLAEARSSASLIWR
jgi:hypothetical protein